MLMPTPKSLGELENPAEFIARHIGVDAADETHMLVWWDPLRAVS